MRQKKHTLISLKPTYAFVVDGDCEVWYLQMLKRNERSLNVNIEPKIPQQKSVCQQFSKVIELAEDYTKVFWIVDLDVITKETREAKGNAKTPLQEFHEYQELLSKKHNNVVIIINNPCFEFWLLLHFSQTSKYFSKCDDARKELKKHHPAYEKTKKFYTKQNKDIYQQLKPKLKDAINNSKKLGTYKFGNPNKALAQMYLFFEDNDFNFNL